MATFFRGSAVSAVKKGSQDGAPYFKGGGGGQKILAIATRGQVPLTNLGGVTAGKTRLKSRLKFRIMTAATEIAVVYANRYTDLITGEANVANPVVVRKAAFEKHGTSTVVPATFSGSRTITLNPGDVDKASDWASLSVSPGDYVWFRSEADVANLTTASYPISKLYRDAFNELPGVETSWSYDPANEVDDVDATGAMTAPSGAAANQNPFCPVLLIGKVANGSRAVVGFGDSITDADDDLPSADGSFGGGYMRRAAYSAGVAYTSTAKSSQRATLVVSNDNSLLRSVLKYHTHMWEAFGSNDIAGNRTAALILADRRVIWGWAKALGLQVWAMSVIQRVDTTDYCTSLANQTPSTPGHDTGGVRDQLNSAVAAEVGTNIDKYIDVKATIADTSDPNKWKLRPFATTLAADVLASATSASLVAAPAVGESLIIQPGESNTSTTTKGQVLRVTGSGPYTASIGATFLGSATHPSGSVVKGSPAAGSSPGVHPAPLANADMAVPIVAALAA